MATVLINCGGGKTYFPAATRIIHHSIATSIIHFAITASILLAPQSGALSRGAFTDPTYILKVGISGDRVSANFFHFPPKFRLRTRKPSRLHCTIASPSICRVCFVFNINTSYIDLLYFDNLLLKTPNLCNLRTFAAIFLSHFTHFFRQFLEAKNRLRQFIHF